MIKPSRMQQQPHRVLPSLKELWEKVLSAMPLRITLTPPTEDVRKLKRAAIKPDSEALRIAELVGEQDVGEEIDATTDHAWLVVLGYFAQVLGLLVELAKVPIEQRKGRDHTPQKKLVEFLVGVLGGIVHLKDLNLAEQPIAKDPTVAEAEPISLHLYFLASVPQNPDLETLDSIKQDDERFKLIDQMFYLHAPAGIGRSKLAARVEKALGVAVTARNWRTVDKIMAMARQAG